MFHALMVAASIATRTPTQNQIKWCWNEPFPVGSGFIIRGKRSKYTLAETDNEVVRVDKIATRPADTARAPEILGYVFVIRNGQKNFSSTFP